MKGHDNPFLPPVKCGKQGNQSAISQISPKPNAGGMRFLMEGVCLRFTESESRRTMEKGGI
jgi:hypothetical protein